MSIKSKNLAPNNNNPRIVCDISNFAYHNCRDSIPKLENVDLIYFSIPKGYEIIGIAYNSLYRQLSE